MAFYDDCTQISPTIGDDGIRQFPADTASFIRVLRFRMHFYSFLKIYKGKIKGLAIYV